MITQTRLIMVPAPPKFATEGVGRHILEISRRLSVDFQVTGVGVQGALWDCLSSRNGYRTVAYRRLFDFPSLLTGSTFLDSALSNLTLMTNFRNAVTAAIEESRVYSVVHTHGFFSATMARRPRGNPNILNNDPPGVILKRLAFGNFISPVTTLLKKQAVEEIGGFKQAAGSVAVDFATFLQLSLRGRFVFVPSYLGFWRRHPDDEKNVNGVR